MLETGTQSPWTSSVGRLFDAVASLLGLHQLIAFEGQAAMAVEFIASSKNQECYPLSWFEKDGLGTLDWGTWVEGLLADMDKNIGKKEMAHKFHVSLVEGVIKAAEAFGQNKVLLGGGCFQNKHLLEEMVRRLSAAGLDVYWPREVPPNDGGLSLGQAVIARDADRPEAIGGAIEQ
jgi:hydrogenase maturation protein HypF